MGLPREGPQMPHGSGAEESHMMPLVRYWKPS